MQEELNGSLSTLQSTLYTLRFTLPKLHFALYAITFTPHTLHPSCHGLPFTFHTLSFFLVSPNHDSGVCYHACGHSGPWASSFFMAEPRREKSKNTKGSLIVFDSTKIKRTTWSNTVAELYVLMKCYGTCQMLRGLIKDITGLSSEIHMRTGANNLVTTASITHVPEQQETIHMIEMLRKEACSGSIADLSHIRTQWCLADCISKKSANPQNLIDAVRSGILKEVDPHPPFRSLLENKAYFRSWFPTVCSHVDVRHDVSMLGDSLRDS